MFPERWGTWGSTNISKPRRGAFLGIIGDPSLGREHAALKSFLQAGLSSLGTPGGQNSQARLVGGTGKGSLTSHISVCPQDGLPGRNSQNSSWCQPFQAVIPALLRGSQDPFSAGPAEGAVDVGMVSLPSYPEPSSDRRLVMSNHRFYKIFSCFPAFSLCSLSLGFLDNIFTSDLFGKSPQESLCVE